MIWTRRAFLQTCLAAAGAAAVVDLVPAAPAQTAVVPLAEVSTEPIWLEEIIASATHGAGMLRLSRGGKSVLQAGLGPGSVYRWIAPPGYEIAHADQLINDSDTDLHVQMVLRQGERVWLVRADGEEVNLATRASVLLTEEAPRGSFAEYVRREAELLRDVA
jgi:hypothetical protein